MSYHWNNFGDIEEGDDTFGKDFKLPNETKVLKCLDKMIKHHHVKDIKHKEYFNFFSERISKLLKLQGMYVSTAIIKESGDLEALMGYSRY